MKNIRKIKVLAIVISASMLLQPVIALAAEVSEEKTEILEEADVSTDSYEEVKEEIENTVSGELADATEQVSEAGALEDYDYEEAENAIDAASDNLSGAATEIEKAEDALKEEQDVSDDFGITINLYEENLDQADSAIDAADKAAADAIKQEGELDEDLATEQEAEKAVENIDNSVNEAEAELAKADEYLTKTQDSYNTASEEYKTLAADSDASEEALSDAKEKVADAEKNLEEAKVNVDENSDKADTAFSDAQKLEVFNRISELKDEIAVMDQDDEGYADKVDALSRLIVEFYILDKVDEGTEVLFDDASEEYITGYETDENGELVPTTQTVTYKTVTYVVDGVSITKKIEFGVNDEGAIAVSEKIVSADESEDIFVPVSEVVLVDENGKEFDVTDTSHVIYIDPEDESKGFYGVDTETSDVISDDIILPENGSVVESTDEEGNKHSKTYKSISATDGESSVSYELIDGNIAEITSREFEVEYVAYDEHTEKQAVPGGRQEVVSALKDRIAELEELYGPGFSTIYEGYSVDSYTLIYYVTGEVSEKTTLEESRKVYKANEYIDRSPEPVYSDDAGNQYDDAQNNVKVLFDPENKKKGFYATNTEDDSLLLAMEYDEPYSNSRFERADNGLQKATYVDIDPAEVNVTTVYSREAIEVIDDFEYKVEKIVPENESDLYEILNSYQGREDVQVILKGIDNDSYDTEIWYGPKWFESIDEDYAFIRDNAGGCLIEITEAVPITHEEIGVVERTITEYKVSTVVYEENVTSGICATEEDAQNTLVRILDEIYDKNNYILDDANIYETEKDGVTGWEYVINYRICTFSQDEIQSFETVKSVYKDTLYLNEQAQRKSFYNVTVADNTLASTDDADFINAIKEKNGAYKKALEAKEKADAAAIAYNKALDAVKAARAAVDALEKAGVPKTILDEATAKLTLAGRNLEKAQMKRGDMDSALIKAQASLKNANEKLAIIKEKNQTTPVTPVVPAVPAVPVSPDVNRADNSAVSGSNEGASPVQASAQTQIQTYVSPVSMVAAAPANDEGAAMSAQNEPVVNTPSEIRAISGAEAQASQIEENAQEQASTSNAGNETDIAKTDAPIISIPDAKPALAAAPVQPVPPVPPVQPDQPKMGLIEKIILIMAFASAAVIAGTLGTLAFIKKPR